MKLYFNQNTTDDLKAILAFLDGVGFNNDGMSMAIDIPKLRSILSGIRQDFPHKDGVDGASIFKKAATFMVYFIAEKPIQSEISGIQNIPADIAASPNHINTLIAIFIAFESLYGALIHCTTGDEKKLNNRIVISQHSFIDIVDAMSTATPNTHFKMASVLLEQLAYKSNPECQYQPLIQWGEN
jgi:hypothetical protein